MLGTPLPALALDDIRVVEPDRDSEGLFDAPETWWVACDKIAAGYAPADVAALLLSMEHDDRNALWDWRRDECRGEQRRDAECPDLPLTLAMRAVDPESLWPLPTIDAETVLPILNQRQELHAVLAMLLTMPSVRSAMVGSALLERATKAVAAVP